MQRIILMANDWPGVEVARYLVLEGEQIIRLYLHARNNRKYGQEIIKASKVKKAQIFDFKKLRDSKHVKGLQKLSCDYIVTVYWAHLLKKEVFNCTQKGTVNFHPALLPVNRGWYPHVHSILDGSPAGITLHKIEEEADTGDIWSQKRIALSELDTAFTIHKRLQKELVKLFKKTWPKIKNGKIQAFSQDSSKAIYHKKLEVDKFDKLDLDKTMKVKDVINLLRARSFGDKGFAYYERGKEKIYLNIKLSKSSYFRIER